MTTTKVFSLPGAFGNPILLLIYLEDSAGLSFSAYHPLGIRTVHAEEHNNRDVFWPEDALNSTQSRNLRHDLLWAYMGWIMQIPRGVWGGLGLV